MVFKTPGQVVILLNGADEHCRIDLIGKLEVGEGRIDGDGVVDLPEIRVFAAPCDGLVGFGIAEIIGVSLLRKAAHQKVCGHGGQIDAVDPDALPLRSHEKNGAVHHFERRESPAVLLRKAKNAGCVHVEGGGVAAIPVRAEKLTAVSDEIDMAARGEGQTASGVVPAGDGSDIDFVKGIVSGVDPEFIVLQLRCIIAAIAVCPARGADHALAVIGDGLPKIFPIVGRITGGSVPWRRRLLLLRGTGGEKKEKQG